MRCLMTFFLQFLYNNLAVANRSRVNNAHGVFRVYMNINFSNVIMSFTSGVTQGR